MDPAVNTILEVVVLEAALCVLIASVCFEHTASRRRCFKWLFILLAAASIGNYFDFGHFKGGGHHLHKMEQYHFFLGSKYLSELGYDGLYDASIVAAREEGLLDGSRVRRRDLTSFELRRTPLGTERRVEVRERFTNERWREFRRDLRFFFAGAKGRPGAYITDHGNTGSPAWAVLAGLFTSTLPLNQATAHVLAYLDVLLLIGLFFACGWAFGERAVALTVIVGLSAPLVYAYLGGSILRMDWLVALGLSICFLEKRYFRIAGLCLGYAIASKVFATVMVIPVGVHIVASTIRRRNLDPGHCRYVSFAAIGLGAFILLPILYFRDADLWLDYWRRLLLTLHEHYYARSHSFRDVFLQFIHYPGTSWNPLPASIAAKASHVSIGSHRVGFFVAQAALLVGVSMVAVRKPLRSSFALGPFVVFIFFVANRYYWQMWMISALALAPGYRRDRRHAFFLAAILAWLAVLHVVELTPPGRMKGGYFGSFLLFWMLLSVVGLEGVMAFKNWRIRLARRRGDGSKRESR